MSSSVWIYTGPEIGERNTAIEALLQKAIKKFGSVDIHRLFASDNKIDQVVSLLQNGDLFSASRFVVLRNAETIKKKEDIQLLCSWIESSENSHAWLVLVSDETSIDKKLEGAAPKENKKIFWEMFENRKEQWIQEFFRKEGFRIESNAVSAMLDMVENNTDALRTACSRFILFFEKGYCITEKDIEEILSHNREENAFTLFDSLIEGDISVSLDIYQKLALSKESSPVQLIAGLTYCFRRLGDWHRLVESGSAGDDFSCKKAGFTSKRAIDQYKNAYRKWDFSTTTRILSLLTATDRDIRSNPSVFHQILFEQAVYAILCRSALRVESPEY